MIVYKLDKPIHAQKILKDIDDLIKKYKLTSDSILLIRITNISYDDACVIPKLEHKNLDH